MMILKGCRPEVVLVAACALFQPILALAQSEPVGTSRINISFVIEGGQINSMSASKRSQADERLEEGLITAKDLLLALHEEQEYDGAQSKIVDGTLLVSIENEDGRILSQEKIAHCNELDLYAEPSDPDQMKAQCDNRLFEYKVMGGGISFLRDGEEIASYALDDGLYLINGSIRRIPASL
ncbi:hypothetical protein [Rhizobium rhizophilum]|uniref:Uncharacterized protein n=1 Tax=Rhizobium rhizophilum TaxID=1850373 RepID=A0ABY2QN75_9HYPH|nr:hypothetical protein [Rhizobium rhizophilum]THV09804.1 hypothetical protein E9677_24920 [Rhizobium rhizophilum]